MALSVARDATWVGAEASIHRSRRGAGPRSGWGEIRTRAAHSGCQQVTTTHGGHVFGIWPPTDMGGSLTDPFATGVGMVIGEVAPGIGYPP